MTFELSPLTFERELKINPFHIMVRESENNVEHLRSRGAVSGIFISRHRSFGRSRVTCSGFSCLHKILTTLYPCKTFTKPR